jgi:endonuclease/exonuclease/phosphatase family metal-dependent hydrolase
MTNQLKILSYNILDVELESNFVPRNMHQSCKDAILKSPTKNGTPVNWDNDFAKKYLPFHKGFGGMSKSQTRKLWGGEEANGDNVNPNLRQILNNLFDEYTATELYNTIKAINFSWVENRLDRVFNNIMENKPDIVCLQEYGNCKDLSSMEKEETIPIKEEGEFSDEINKKKDSAVENEDEKKIQVGSLADKLIGLGYIYTLYSYNPDKSNGDDGIAIFYKASVLKGSEFFDNKIYIDMDKDLKQKYKEYTTQRGCGLLELTHRTTSKKCIICTTHIQTSSNEKVKGNPYAIREGELTYIKEYINKRYTNTNDLVIFCGDLNLDLNNATDNMVVTKFESGCILKRIKYRETDDIGLVTSYPTGRQEYIDYFFTNCGGVLSGDFKEKKDLNGETIPNGTDQPSDHIPILLTIDLDKPKADTVVGGVTRKTKKAKAKKSMKPKAKKSKKPKTKKTRRF